MPDLLPLLVLVLALASGLLAAIVVSQHMQAVQSGFYRHFLTQILLFNLLLLSGLVLQFLQRQAPATGWHPLVMPALLIILAALKAGWLDSFIMTTLAPFSGTIHMRWGRQLRIGILAAFCCFTAALAAAWILPAAAVLQTSIIIYELLIIGGALLAAAYLLRSSRALPAGRRRRALMIFGLFHFGLMSLILAALITGWIQPGPQTETHTLANAAFLLVYNLFPLLWTRFYQPARHAPAGEKLESFGITPREREIIELIQAGRTNREIAERLFISVATVKDYNSKLFRKCGVRNRVELGNLFR